MGNRGTQTVRTGVIGVVVGIAAMLWLLLSASAAAALEQPDTIDLNTLNMVPERTWGVSGQNPANTQTETLDVLVYDFAQSGDYMFVGGAFLNVQESKNATPIPQAYVAAFDIYTGDWVDTWTPSFDRAVYALEVLPNGSLLVGGEFEQVNGTTRRGLVALDPITGAIDPSFAGAVDRPWSSRRATVRDMKVEPNGRIYVAGSFSHLDGVGGSRTVVSKAGRFTNAAGVLDTSWKPQVSGGPVWGLDTDTSRGEVALSGFFTSVNAEAQTGHFHVVSDVDGSTSPGKIELPRNYPWSQLEMWDVAYGDGLIFAIGEQHVVQVLRSSDHQMLGYHTTGHASDGFTWTNGFGGGSYQAGERIGDVLFIGCHCTSGTNNHYESFTGRRTTRRTVMAYDAATGRHLEQFNADVQSPRDGFWAAASDTTGCLYLGGDYHVGGTQARQERWLGGFAKLCSPRAATSIVDPGAQSSTIGQSVNLGLTTEGVAGQDLVFAATGLPDGLTIDEATGAITGTPTVVGQYAVAVTVTDRFGSQDTTSFDWEVTLSGDVLIDTGATWRYDDSGQNLGATWRQPGFVDDGWASGPAEFGFGDGDEATLWTAGSVTYYARTSFDFAGAAPSSLGLTLKADDGAVVYLNGTEVFRDNMPLGGINYQTGASNWRGGAEEGFTTHVIPAGALIQGTNVVAVEVHNVWSGNNDLSFDLELRASDEQAPAGPRPELVAVGSQWNHTDSTNGAPAGWPSDLAGSPTGAAEFGFGDQDEATVLTAGQEAYYFAKTFAVDDPAAYDDLSLGLAADDGAVVFLNGTELMRVRMPEGPVAFNTRPTTWASGSNERLVEYQVPSDGLVAGDNVIAVEVHNLWPGNADVSFDLYLRERPLDDDRRVNAPADR